MKVALGFKAHSGWAALVVIGRNGDDFEIVGRRRIELIDEGEMWSKAPYHAAESLEPAEARLLVKRGIEAAHRVAPKEMRQVVEWLMLDHTIVACAVLKPAPMPEWSTDEILAVHFRMHKAEGVLFPEALGRAAATCKLKVVSVPEKELDEIARVSLDPHDPSEIIAKLGRSAGPPWARDQKTAALAAMIALKQYLGQEKQQ